MKLQSIRPFFIRLFIFCIAFIVITGILGPWIISTRLLYGFHFFIYANMGKMILFSAVAFIILSRAKIKNIPLFPWERKQYFFSLLTILLMFLFYYMGTLLLKEKNAFDNLSLFFLSHLIIIAVPLSLTLAVFGVRFLRSFFHIFRAELLICLGLSVVFYFAIFQVWKLWPYLSRAVLHSVAFLLSFHISPVREIGPLTLLAGTFAVRVEQACSGLDSIFLFTTLYMLIGLVDWHQFHKWRFILIYFPALAGMFAINILRVYILILVGVYISPKLALQLFHTYLGMVLFIAYFFLFLKLTTPYLKKSSSNET